MILLLRLINSLMTIKPGFNIRLTTLDENAPENNTEEKYDVSLTEPLKELEQKVVAIKSISRKLVRRINEITEKDVNILRVDVCGQFKNALTLNRKMSRFLEEVTY